MTQVATNSNPESDIRPSDRFIPWLFVLFFAVIFAVNGVFIYYALESNPGVVTEDSYEKGLAFNKTIEKAERQAELGWSGDIAASEVDGAMTFALRDKAGKPISGATVRAEFTRPVRDGSDFSLTLTEGKAGIYRGDIHAPFKGAWTVRVFAEKDGQVFEESSPVVLK
jgi:nitrogen fixation protein FixH